MGRFLQKLKYFSLVLLAFLLFACGGQGGGTEVGNPGPVQTPSNGGANPSPGSEPSTSPPPSIGEDPCENPYSASAKKQGCPFEGENQDPKHISPHSLNNEESLTPEAPEVDPEVQS